VERTQLLAWIDEHPVIAERLLRLLAKELSGWRNDSGSRRTAR
jgi:CRP-like cAMP-binding protein